MVKSQLHPDRNKHYGKTLVPLVMNSSEAMTGAQGYESNTIAQGEGNGGAPDSRSFPSLQDFLYSSPSLSSDLSAAVDVSREVPLKEATSEEEEEEEEEESSVFMHTQLNRIPTVLPYPNPLIRDSAPVYLDTATPEGVVIRQSDEEERRKERFTVAKALIDSKY